MICALVKKSDFTDIWGKGTEIGPDTFSFISKHGAELCPHSKGILK